MTILTKLPCGENATPYFSLDLVNRFADTTDIMPIELILSELSFLLGYSLIVARQAFLNALFDILVPLEAWYMDVKVIE